MKLQSIVTFRILISIIIIFIDQPPDTTPNNIIECIYKVPEQQQPSGGQPPSPTTIARQPEAAVVVVVANGGRRHVLYLKKFIWGMAENNTSKFNSNCIFGPSSFGRATHRKRVVVLFGGSHVIYTLDGRALLLFHGHPKSSYCRHSQSY